MGKPIHTKPRCHDCGKSKVELEMRFGDKVLSCRGCFLEYQRNQTIAFVPNRWRRDVHARFSKVT